MKRRRRRSTYGRQGGRKRTRSTSRRSRVDGVARARRDDRARTFPNAHANGGNTALRCPAGVDTIWSTIAFTADGCGGRGRGRTWKEGGRDGWRGSANEISTPRRARLASDQRRYDRGRDARGSSSRDVRGRYRAPCPPSSSAGRPSPSWLGWKKRPLASRLFTLMMRRRRSDARRHRALALNRRSRDGIGSREYARRVSCSNGPTRVRNDPASASDVASAEVLTSRSLPRFAPRRAVRPLLLQLLLQSVRGEI